MNFNKKFWTMTLSAAMAASLLAGCCRMCRSRQQR